MIGKYGKWALKVSKLDRDRFWVDGISAGKGGEVSNVLMDGVRHVQRISWDK
jgi:hypothetical protein